MMEGELDHVDYEDNFNQNVVEVNGMKKGEQIMDEEKDKVLE